MSQLSKELFIYGLGGILNRGIGFLLIPLYTSYLTVEEYGMLAILGVILQLVGLVSLMGVGTAAMRFYHNEGADEDYRKKLYGNAFILLLVGPAVFFALTLAVSYLSPSTQIAGVNFYPLVFIVLLIGVLSPINKLLIGLFRVKRKPMAFITYNLLFFALQAVIIIMLVAVLELGILGQVSGQFIATIVMFVVATVMLVRYCTFKFDKSLAKQLLMFGLPLLPYFIFAWMYSSASRFAIQNQLDLHSVGVFFLAAQFAGILGLVHTALDNAFTPHFYSNANAQDGKKVLSQLMLRYITGFSFLALLLVATAPHAIRLFATGEYLMANQFVALLVLANLLFAFASPIQWSLTFSKQSIALSQVRVVATAFLVFLLGLLIWLDSFSINGVITSMILANLLMLILGTNKAQKHFELELDRLKLVVMLLTFGVLGILINYITVNMSWQTSLPISSVILIIAAYVGLRVTNFQLRSMRIN